MTAAHEIGNLLAHRFDQAANSLAMTDLRAKPEVARGRLDIEWTPRGLWFAAIDLEAHWLAGGRRRGSNILGSDFFWMCNKVAELLPAIGEAGLDRRARGIVDVDIGPIGHRLYAGGLVRDRGAN